MPRISLPSHGLHFVCLPGQSVLDAMRPVHFTRINAGCHNGGCGVCKIRVLDGCFTTGLMSAAHVLPDEQASGVALACRAYPAGDISIEVIGKLPTRMIGSSGYCWPKNVSSNA